MVGPNGPIVKAKYAIKLANLEALPINDWKESFGIELLHGDLAGFFEIKVTHQRVQYRLLGFHGPGRREVTLVCGAREINNRWEPRATPNTARGRRTDVVSSPNTYRRSHDYG